MDSEASLLILINAFRNRDDSSRRPTAGNVLGFGEGGIGFIIFNDDIPSNNTFTSIQMKFFILDLEVKTPIRLSLQGCQIAESIFQFLKSFWVSGFLGFT